MGKLRPGEAKGLEQSLGGPKPRQLCTSEDPESGRGGPSWRAGLGAPCAFLRRSRVGPGPFTRFYFSPLLKKCVKTATHPLHRNFAKINRIISEQFLERCEGKLPSRRTKENNNNNYYI